MKREPWAIANTFAYAIRVLNCIFCRHPEKEGWTEDDKEASNETHWLIAEQINSMCSDMMIEDARDVLKMISVIPANRLCERLDCLFHHPENFQRYDYNKFADKCNKCSHNEKCKLDKYNKIEHFESK